MTLVRTTIYSSTKDSWAETDKIPISERCIDVRIDSHCRVRLQSRFTRHTSFQYEICFHQMQEKCDDPCPLQAV